MNLMRYARSALLLILTFSFHQIAAAQVQSLTGDECVERFDKLDGSSLRRLVKSQPQPAVVCVDALLNGYVEFEGAGRVEEAARYLQLADRFAQTHSAIWNRPLLTAQVALYRNWSPAQKREKIQAVKQWYVGQELYSKGDAEGALKIWLEDVKVDKRLGDLWGEASSLILIGVVYKNLGREGEALACQQRSLAINRRIGHTSGTADNFLYIGDLLEEKSPAEAGKLYLRALDIKRMIRDARGEINALTHLGSLYEKLGRTRIAAKYYRQLLAVPDKSRYLPWNLIAQYLLRMGGLFLKLDLTRDASQATRQLEELLRQAGIAPVIRGQVLTEAAELYEKAGQPDVALQYYEKVLAGYGEGNYLKETGNTLTRMGILHKNRSQYGRAMEHYSRAFDAYEKVGDRLGMTDVANNIGIVLDRQGFYNKALEFYGFALGGYKEALRKAGDDEQAAAHANKSIADAMNNIGITFVNLGQYDRALEFYQDVEKRYDASVPPGDSARLALNMGAAYAKLERYDEARRYFQQAQAKFEEADNPGGAAGALVNQAVLLKDRGQQAEARKLFERALEIYRRLSRPKEAAMIFYNIGRSYEEEDDYDKALLPYTLAKDLGRRMEDPEIMWRSDAGMASCLERLNRPLEALDHNKAAINEIESLRKYAGNGRRDNLLQVAFFADKLHPYTALVRLLLKLSRQKGGESYLEQAFEYADRGKGRGLLDLLAESRALAQVEAPAELVRRIIEADALISTYEGSLRVERAKPSTQRDKQLIAEYQQRLEQAAQEQQRAREELAEKYPRYVELTNPRPVTLAEVQGNMLSEREVLIEYVVTQDDTLAFVVSKTGMKVITLKLTAEELYDRVAALRKSLVKAREYDAGVAHELYERLFRPVEVHLGKAASVYIVPDSALHYVPFEALLTSPEPRFRASSFLLNKYTFAYVPSAGVLGIVLADERRKRASPPPQRPLVVFANPMYGQEGSRADGPVVEGADEMWDDCQSPHFLPLPDTEEEAKSIARTFGMDLADPAFNVRGQAGESHVKALDLSAYRYVHFATHGIICDQSGEASLQSSLVLSLAGVPVEQQKAGDEGFLQMDEIFNLRLNADLVTLSACRTGLGANAEGEGIIGLTRAFMYAGTPSVLVSQWGVADKSTAMFMNRFYLNLRNGLSKGQALHEAKVWMLNNSYHNEVRDGYRHMVAHDHPYFWAPFVLVGAN